MNCLCNNRNQELHENEKEAHVAGNKKAEAPDCVARFAW